MNTVVWLVVYLFASWVIALYYGDLYCKSLTKYSKPFIPQDSIGVKDVIKLLLGLAAMIFALKYLVLLNWKWLIPGLVAIGVMIYTALFKETKRLIKYCLRDSPVLSSALVTISSILIAGLIAKQIFFLDEISNNIFMLGMVLISVPLGMSMRRSGMALLFGAIWIFDWYLVWGTSWYIGIAQSEAIRHWPVPLGFRVGSHILGGGDILFMSVVVIYARKIFNKKAGILSGLLMTLPLAYLTCIWQLAPSWRFPVPYTIFIAPVALILTALPHKKHETPPVPEPQAVTAS